MSNRHNNDSNMYLSHQPEERVGEDESLYTAEDSTDAHPNARPPPINPHNNNNNNNNTNASSSHSRREAAAVMAGSHNYLYPRYDMTPPIGDLPPHDVSYKNNRSLDQSYESTPSAFSSQGALSVYSNHSSSQVEEYGDDEDMCPMDPHNNSNMESDCVEANTTFIVPGQIHPNMENREDDIAQLRLLAGKLSADWRGSGM